MTESRYLEEHVLMADPLELTHIVYRHALEMVKDARRQLANGEIAARSRSITRAIDAINELDGVLDRTNGQQVAKNLAGLYRYMGTRLTAANFEQKDAPLAEVESLLATLTEAWSAIRPSASIEAEPASPNPAATSGWSGAMFGEPAREMAHSWSA